MGTGSSAIVKSISTTLLSFLKANRFLKAGFSNFDDVAYNIKAKGTIDVGKVYRVFSKEGLGLDGFIKADVDSRAGKAMRPTAITPNSTTAGRCNCKISGPDRSISPNRL
jgi:hypothetical protein